MESLKVNTTRNFLVDMIYQKSIDKWSFKLVAQNLGKPQRKPKQPTPSSFGINQNNFPSKFGSNSNQNQKAFTFETNNQPFDYGVKNR